MVEETGVLPIPTKVRVYLYSVISVLAGLLVTYGVLDDQQWAVWLGLVKAVLEIPVAEAALRVVNVNGQR